VARNKLDLVGVLEVRWNEGGTIRAENYTFSYGNGNKDFQFRIGLFVHHRVVSAVKRVAFVSDTMSYVVLRGG
jgi:hypothetical protein